MSAIQMSAIQNLLDILDLEQLEVNVFRNGDQSDPVVLASAIERLGGGGDLVIDDGSHLGRHQIPTFEYLYPRISERGLYVCEDLHCSYWPTYEGGLRREDTFIEHAKGLIDRLQAWTWKATRRPPPCRSPKRLTGFSSISILSLSKSVRLAAREPPVGSLLGGRMDG
jgi:hypothetical protein